MYKNCIGIYKGLPLSWNIRCIKKIPIIPLINHIENDNKIISIEISNRYLKNLYGIIQRSPVIKNKKLYMHLSQFSIISLNISLLDSYQKNIMVGNKSL